MRHILRLCVFAGAMAALFGLPPLASTTSNQALAQITVVVPGVNRSYYNGYSSHYNRGYVQHGYTVYGNGPYGYGSTTYGYRSTAPFGFRSSAGYGYRHGTSQSLYYRDLRLHGGTGTYRRIYIPPTTRYYSPYGYGGGYGAGYRGY